MLVVITTTPNIGEAEELAAKLVEAKLAACVQILLQIQSVYFWEGKVQNESEHLLLIKTNSAKFTGLSEFIKSNHSYETPEIVALKAEDVEQSYLKWVDYYLS